VTVNSAVGALFGPFDTSIVTVATVDALGVVTLNLTLKVPF